MALGALITLDELERDPDPILERLRIYEPVAWMERLDMWFVTLWDDLVFMEDHPELFSATTDPSLLVRALGPNMMTIDPPQHTAIRHKMVGAFQPGGRSGDFVREELTGIIDSYLDALDPMEPVDLMADFAQPVAATALASVLGFDDVSAADMWEWCAALCGDIANFMDAAEPRMMGEWARHDLGGAIRRQLQRLDSLPDGAGLRHFVAEGATETEIVNNIRLMIAGGINEPRDGIGLVIWTLLAHDELREAVEHDQRLWRRLVEEVLRVHSPVGTITRQATRDLELRGVPIRRGDKVSGVLRSANHDARRWTNPYAIDLGRREGTHAAFALGDHRCIGEWLGRQTIKIAAQRLFERHPSVRLAKDPELHGFEFRGPRDLFVRIDG